MKKTRVQLLITTLLMCYLSGYSQSCQSDTISSDIIFLVDNSGSIDDGEYANFEQLILATIQKTQQKCQHAQVAVIHYGGAFGAFTSIEYPLSKNNIINNINRQYCTQRIAGQCVGGGGDDLNNAIGQILASLQNGQLNRDPRNEMNLIILTDAFGTEDTCTFTNCSIIRPYTNIDQFKTLYDATVTVVGMSSQAASTFLGVYASPGGSYASTTLFTPDCLSTVDGCQLPRKYVPLAFNSPIGAASDSIVHCIDCRVEIVSPLAFNITSDLTAICANRGESAMLNINVTSGLPPYNIAWSDGITTHSRVVSPTTTSVYNVTVSDANGCTSSRSITITVNDCGPICPPNTALTVDAGVEQTICFNLGQSVTLTANIQAGSGSGMYQYAWTISGINVGNTPSITVSPSTTTTYSLRVVDTVTSCDATNSVTVNSRTCSTCIANAGRPVPHTEICLSNGSANIFTSRNQGVVIPNGYSEVFILTDEDLVIVDYSIGSRTFNVRQEGIYRVHTLVAVTTRGRPDFIDLPTLIQRNVSKLFVIVACIEDHGICADFDFPGRVHKVLGPGDRACILFENTIALCSDGIDNDLDGLIDCSDPDCVGLVPCLENTLIACNDQYDNDMDGLIDCMDPDCFMFEICSERGDKCNDGIDNDGDGLIDCEDPSCRDSKWCKEDSPFTCADGIDNDGNGLTDCEEPSCQRFIVCAESTLAACQDGIDNDFDGLIDCADSDCHRFTQICRPAENTNAMCSDKIDNDGDGLIDCHDPDCHDTAPCGNVAGFAVAPELEIRVFLQGPLQEGGLMSTSLNDQGYLPGQRPKTFFGISTPAGQPYDEAPWFYDGGEGSLLQKKNKNSAYFEYPATVVDWVLVSIRTDVDRSSEVWKSAALLHNNGEISFLKDINFDIAYEHGFFIVIEHRNHLPVMSERRVKFSNNTLSYDFSQQDSYRSFVGVGQVKCPDKWVMAAGNGDMVMELSSYTDINVRDLTLWLQNNGVNSSYQLEDYDMNGDINIRDRILWELNNGIFSSLRTK